MRGYRHINSNVNMNSHRILKILSRFKNEIFLDLKNGDYQKIFHFFSILPRQILLKYPRNVSIEPINSCNLDCEFCSSPPELIGRPLQAMKLDEFKKIIDNVKRYTHHIWLFLAGEPFLNPHFPEMIKYATKNNLHATTSSNGNVIDKTLAEKIVVSGLDKLILSLDGTDQETYQAMRKGGNFQKVISGIKYINAEKVKQRKLKPEIEVQFIFSKINQHQRQEFEKLARSLGVNYCIKSLGIPTWIYDEKKCDEIAEKFLPDFGKKRYDEGQNLKREPSCSNAQRCFILSNGTICICCYDIKGEYKMGNIFEDDFLKVWQSKRYINMRRLMEKRKLPLCNKCGETSEL